jgi:hypothetical protein
VPSIKIVRGANSFNAINKLNQKEKEENNTYALVDHYQRLQDAHPRWGRYKDQWPTPHLMNKTSHHKMNPFPPTVMIC